MYQLEELSFADLKNNFDKRIWHFEPYQRKLEKTNSRLLHWIGSVDYSGYVREKSLRYLIDNYQPGDENRILLRLEDWVEEVRKPAIQWTKDNFHRLSLEQINENYRLIFYLAIKQRDYICSSVKVIEEVLIDKLKNITAQEFNNLNSNFRKYLYRLALPENQNLRSFLIQDQDPINRLLLLKIFDYSRLKPEEIKILEQDKCALVKKSFIYYQLKYNVQPTQSYLSRLALDKSKSVREIAGYYLTKYYNIDPYQLYKSRIDRQFYYIADFAKEEDLNYFLEGMRSPEKSTKLICLKALCELNPKLAKQFDLQTLIQENNQFRQLIKKRVLPILSLKELQDFRTILFTELDGQIIYLSLLDKKSYWHFVEQSLDLIIDCPNDEVINLFNRSLYQKINIYRSISIEQKQKIMTKIDKLEATRDNHLSYFCQTLRFVLQNA